MNFSARTILQAALTISLLLSARPSLAETTAPGAVDFSFGIYCAEEGLEQVEADDTISGVVNLLPYTPVFVRRTPIIPATIGIGFGVHVTVLPEFTGTAVIETRHPPMGPNGIMVETWVTDFSADRVAHNGFTFEHPYELVQGDWSISASINGRLIYHVDFTIVDPGFAPPVNCAAGLLS